MASSAQPHDEPLLLYTTPAEQDKYASFADLYAIIKSVEKLEKAYVRDAVRPDEYEKACLDLIAKFKTLRTALRDDGVPDVEHFMATYKMDCASAAQRLLRSGLPATIEHGKPRAAGGASDAAAVAEATQHFITAMDVLKLGMHEVDQARAPARLCCGASLLVPEASRSRAHARRSRRRSETCTRRCTECRSCRPTGRGRRKCAAGWRSWAGCVPWTGWTRAPAGSSPSTWTPRTRASTESWEAAATRDLRPTWEGGKPELPCLAADPRSHVCSGACTLEMV